MIRIIQAILLMSFAFSVTGREAVALIQREELPIEDQVIINKRDFYESCFDMEEGEILSFCFVAGFKLEYDIHYHKGDKTITILGPSYGSDDCGVIRISESAEICMMWQNDNFREATKLEYEAKLITEDEVGRRYDSDEIDRR